MDGVTVYGPEPERRGSPLCAFNVEGIHPTDLSTFLDFEGKRDSLTSSLGHGVSLPQEFVGSYLDSVANCTLGKLSPDEQHA